MNNKIDPGKLSDRELLLVMHTQLVNHLAHHDFWTKILLSVGLMGVINFTIGLMLILLRFGIIVGQGG